MKFTKSKFIPIFLFIILLLPVSVFAGALVIEIDTKGLSINAIEGKVTLPTGLDVSQIQTGESAILIWIKKPEVNTESSVIEFAGLTPGGFQGRKPLFTIVGDFDDSSVSKISFNDITAFKNDGEGTRAEVSLLTLNSTIQTDEVIPEPFAITFSESKDIFEGKRFATFYAQDKQSGIDRYEVAEKSLFHPKESDWKIVQSPYEVKDPSMLKKLYVKAIDEEGNFRIEAKSLPNRKFAFLFLAIIILSICVTLVRRSREELSSPYSS